VIGNELSVDYGKTLPKSIALFNGLGKVLMENNLGETVSNGVFKIPVTGLPNGMYFVRIKYSNQSVIKKFIVTR
jgi:hypothetical protein